MQQYYKFQFKKNKAKTAKLFKYTGTWEELEMYYPGCVIVSYIQIDESDLVLEAN